MVAGVKKVGIVKRGDESEGGILWKGKERVA